MVLGDFWNETGIAIVVLALVFTLVIVVIWQFFVTARARMSVAREDAYRTLASEATDAQRRTAKALEEAVAELVDLRQRTSELERVLKTVE